MISVIILFLVFVVGSAVVNGFLHARQQSRLDIPDRFERIREITDKIDRLLNKPSPEEHRQDAPPSEVQPTADTARG